MDDLKILRTKIDFLDDQLMELLEKRFALSEEIGTLKAKQGVGITHKNREDAILFKANKFQSVSLIQAVYEEIFRQSKKIQEEKV